MNTKAVKPSEDPDLFYLNESDLSTSDEEDLMALWESGTKVEEIVDPVKREAYRKLVATMGEDANDALGEY